MEANSPESPTRLLLESRAGKSQSAQQLFDLLYNELRELANAHLRHERREHTLQATALVHEAWIKLVDYTGIASGEAEARREFFGIAARAMRQVLVDHARRRGRAKRQGNGLRITLSDNISASPVDDDTLIDLDEAINELGSRQPRMAKVCELRIFGGLTIDEITVLVEGSRATIKLDWQLGRALLSKRCRDLK